MHCLGLFGFFGRALEVSAPLHLFQSAVARSTAVLGRGDDLSGAGLEAGTAALGARGPVGEDAEYAVYSSWGRHLGLVADVLVARLDLLQVGVAAGVFRFGFSFDFVSHTVQVKALANF